MKNNTFNFDEEVMVKLEDILNSQQSLIEKIGVIQVDLFNAPDSALEKRLDDLNALSNDNFEVMTTLIEDYRQAETQEG